jgi:phosphate transport system permease protein
MGRAIGETAAVLLTAGYAREIPGSLLHQAASLPNMIYNYFEFAARTPSLMDKLYAVAFVLIVIVLILNTISRLIGYRYSRMIKH